MSWKQRVARESLWALGCVLAVATLNVTVIANMKSGPHGGWLNVSASAWAVLWDEWLGGHFLLVTGVVYGLVLAVRLSTWAVGMARHAP